MREVERDDPAFLWALGVSVMCHLIVIALQAITIRAGRPPLVRKTTEVVYDQPSSEAAKQVRETLSHLTARATELPSLTMSTPQIRVGGGPTGGLLDRLSGFGDQEASGVLGRAGTSVSSSLSTPSLLQTAVVDLGNLAEASQGDPVLLSYFSAIREQIQRTANRRTWISSDASEGIIYVTFLLTPAGHVRSPQVLPDRSASSALLQEIAVKIIAASSPFPPLPPSLHGAAKTIVVPLEFLRSS